MQHILIHIDQSLGPIGAWSYDTHGHLTHFYPDSLDTAISARARELMAARDNTMAVPEWMHLIAGTEPTLLDEYQTFETNEGQPLNHILADFRRSWVSSD